MKRAALAVALFLFGVVSETTLAQTAGTSPETLLDRRVTLHARDIPLRDALDRIAALAGLRLSYSGDNLPLDRRVTITRDTATVGELLSELLRPYAVRAAVVGDDHLVLAPRDPQPAITDSSSGAVRVLDRVVVTGSVLGAPQRALPVALDVVRGRDIERRDESQLSRVLNGAVPGVWLWEQAPSTMLARYGSIRGASSFGLSFPKVYIDGIEVANPLLLTQVTPELVERVEVIRGPQGAALYGSDAISGVMNIVSRHDGAADGAHAIVRSEGGYTTAYHTQRVVPMQQHSLTLRRGSNLRSAGLTVSGSSSGDYVPHGYSRELRSVLDARVIGARSTLTATARFLAKNAGVATSPPLDSVRPGGFPSDSHPQLLRTFALGSTYSRAASDDWTYALTAGVDGYRLSNVSNDFAPIPSVADTALRDATGSALRATIRASTVSQRATAEGLNTRVTLAAEQSLLRDQTSGELTAIPVSRPHDIAEPATSVGVSGNTGVSSQVDLGWGNTTFFTSGLRFELIAQPARSMQVAALPMVGGAWVHDMRSATLKLRAAYGRGIRAPQSTLHVVTREPRRTVVNPLLDPEAQSGVEAGADLFLGQAFAIHVTRFDQRVTGLIQMVTIGDTTRTSGSGPGGGGGSRYWFQLQNVGEITNTGWEGQASAYVGALTVSGAATTVDSRVRQLARGYSGDLRPGDRMLAVPALTVSGSVLWSLRRLQLTSTASRAMDWINYDRVAITDAWFDAGGNAQGITGNKLRTFWVKYNGALRLRASATYDLWRGIQGTLGGDNLLNYQRGEPDTVTVVPGRTISAGIRARF